MRYLIAPLGLAAAILLSSPVFSQSDDSPAAAAGELSHPGIVEPSSPLTLDEALALAAQTNPDLAIVNREVEAVAATRLQAQVLPNPELSFDAENIGTPARETTVQIGQPIELGGKRDARITEAEQARDVAGAELSVKQADIRATVIQVFYEVLAAQERQYLAQASLELAGRALDAASRQVKAGKVSPVVETKARIAESGARLELNQAAVELVNARKRLSATWGNFSPRFTEAIGQLETLPPVLPEDALFGRLESSPEFVRAREEIERREAAVVVERTKRISDVTVSAGVRRLAETDENTAVVGVAVPIPIFNRNQGNLLEALRRVDKARDEQTATEVRLRVELSQAHERLEATRREVESIRDEILPGAESTLEAATKGFELGKFTFLDVLDAQRTLFQARNQYVRALVDAHRAWADIERILGSQSSSGTNAN